VKFTHPQRLDQTSRFFAAKIQKIAKSSFIYAPFAPFRGYSVRGV
jgi:hypothetical protein